MDCRIYVLAGLRICRKISSAILDAVFIGIEIFRKMFSCLSRLFEMTARRFSLVLKFKVQMLRDKV